MIPENLEVPSSLDHLRRQIAMITREDPSQIADDDNLVDIGLDSIRAMALVSAWNRAGVEVEWARFAERPRLVDWWKLIANDVPAGGTSTGQ